MEVEKEKTCKRFKISLSEREARALRKDMLYIRLLATQKEQELSNDLEGIKTRLILKSLHSKYYEFETFLDLALQ